MRWNLTLDEYQNYALNTWKGKLPGTELGRVYLALKLAGEAGEAAEKCGKLIRDKQGLIDISGGDKHAIALELGDVLWYLSVLAGELGFTLEEVANMNLEKLRDREARGVLGGSGDNR
jgi:NTP pyrophosphatase (non-canonical NTP hydrolase)